ncbi:type II toxin-antitoxin system VapC family toxin [Streptomyces himalayensis]|uniref:Ribonuclease VapC n=2 Tax=Streptomyces himalayensis TaxID=2820085 RepID=A0A7W2HKJ9_9ACTN|nr:type II toxin-antitoxin system VapC family toxin [Streptomyces himalayensis]MBA2944824.1 type II toxin-antitoxin system VapC family toxin [Streptomyces himalayensis subsp. himalayensis]MBA4866969.1 type II toxin-antitoxin system VapC family toxin [Streptomyces himalayensis subsp. aureolus]
MIYLDSAAVVKLVRREHASAELNTWLNERPDEPLVASSLVEVEVPRALRRASPQALAGVPGALTRLYRLEIDQAVRATAAAYSDPHLRSLDAIHLATAQLLAGQPGAEPLTFVTYDQRLLKAAESTGLNVAAPGA